MRREVRIASRGSKLALAQADIVRRSLEKMSPGVEFSIVKISTRGDRDKSCFLYKSESVGLFTSEVENAVLSGRADVAVHSLKDLPTAGSQELLVAAVMKREAVADALVASGRAGSIEELPVGAVVGTSSLRRIAQLKYLRPDLQCVPLRGNVETRVRKVQSGGVDAAVVACAGLYRLGLSDRISAVLDPEQFLTAPGQGALAVQIRADDAELRRLVRGLDDEPTRVATEAERCVLAAMRGGCSIPLGAYARVADNRLVIDAMIADIDGRNLIRRCSSSTLDESHSCAIKLAEELLQVGGREILERIRSA
ncbi:MAG TPA: hydroxymethylbilane synthase [Sedimentisphaerales bacterium]|nr:hydroxymethylbilane synthase [Sedimentisphaerales bacterium]